MRRPRWGVGVALAVSLLGLSSLGQQHLPPAHGPNVILIMTDDMRMDDLQFMPFTRELIGEQGVTFPQSLSPYPLCCPARAELLSGQYSHNNGVQSNALPRGGYYKLDSSNTLATWLHDQGYDTAFMGKYLNQYGMLGPREVPAGWDQWQGFLGNVYDYRNSVVNVDGTVEQKLDVFKTDLLDQHSTQLVRRLGKADRPYFMWVSYVAPHSACSYPNSEGHGCWHAPDPAPPDRHTFAGLAPLTDPSINERDMSDKGAFMRALPLLTPAKLAQREFNRIKRIEALQSVDRAVAHMVATLKATHQYDNTYLMFTSDNGLNLGEHRWVFKVLGYEPSLLVPLLIEGPGIPHGVVRQQEVTTVDLASTISDMTDTTPTRLQDGMSLLPLAQGTTPDTGDRIVPIEAAPIDTVAPQWLYQGVRTNRYTLFQWDDGEIELYDRLLDPFEMASVDGQPAYAAIEHYLLTKLREIRDCAGPACVSWVGTHPLVPTPTTP